MSDAALQVAPHILVMRGAASVARAGVPLVVAIVQPTGAQADAAAGKPRIQRRPTPTQLAEEAVFYGVAHDEASADAEALGIA